MDVTACGEVIVTDLAIVVVAPDPRKAKAMNAGAYMVGGGGIGGALAGVSLTGSAGGSLLNLDNAQAVPPLESMKRVTTCWPAEVPEELSRLKGWPTLDATRPLTFYPKNLVGVVRLSWTGEMSLALASGGEDITAGVNFWQVSKAKGHLARAGYKLE